MNKEKIGTKSMIHLLSTIENLQIEEKTQILERLIKSLRCIKISSERPLSAKTVQIVNVCAKPDCAWLEGDVLVIYAKHESIKTEESDIKYIRADLVKEATSKIIELCTDENDKPYNNLFEQIIKIAKEIQ